jgi:hypothetical protein
MTDFVGGGSRGRRFPSLATLIGPPCGRTHRALPARPPRSRVPMRPCTAGLTKTPRIPQQVGQGSLPLFSTRHAFHPPCLLQLTSQTSAGVAAIWRSATESRDSQAAPLFVLPGQNRGCGLETFRQCSQQESMGAQLGQRLDDERKTVGRHALMRLLAALNSIFVLATDHAARC